MDWQIKKDEIDRRWKNKQTACVCTGGNNNVTWNLSLQSNIFNVMDMKRKAHLWPLFWFWAYQMPIKSTHLIKTSYTWLLEPHATYLDEVDFARKWDANQISSFGFWFDVGFGMANAAMIGHSLAAFGPSRIPSWLYIYRTYAYF